MCKCGVYVLPSAICLQYLFFKQYITVLPLHVYNFSISSGTKFNIHSLVNKKQNLEQQNRYLDISDRG